MSSYRESKYMAIFNTTKDSLGNMIQSLEDEFDGLTDIEDNDENNASVGQEDNTPRTPIPTGRGVPLSVNPDAATSILSGLSLGCSSLASTPATLQKKGLLTFEDMLRNNEVTPMIIDILFDPAKLMELANSEPYSTMRREVIQNLRPLSTLISKLVNDQTSQHDEGINHAQAKLSKSK